MIVLRLAQEVSSRISPVVRELLITGSYVTIAFKLNVLHSHRRPVGYFIAADSCFHAN